MSTGPTTDPLAAPTLRVRSRWALALRLARREARRHPWRHALVVVLIFVPVLATFATFSGIDTSIDLERGRTERALSGADALIDLPPQSTTGEAPSRRPLADPSPGVHVERLRQGVDWLVLPTGPSASSDPALAATQTIAVPSGGRLARRFRVDAGRLPRGRHEVFLTAPAAAVGHWRVGDRLSLATATDPFTVVGTGVARDDTRARLTVLSESVPAAYWTRVIEAVPAVAVNGTYLDPNQQVEQLAVWAPAGADPSSVEPIRSAWAWTQPEQPITADPAVRIGVAVASAGLAMIVAVVASAAFAIGARRQLRNVGLLATAGADPAAVRASLVLQGAIPGVVASAVAIATGVAVAMVLNGRQFLERGHHVVGAQVLLSAPGAALAAAIGVGAGVAAAWQPARSTSRLPLLSALGGRKPVRPVRARVPLAGAALVVVGFALLAVARWVVAEGPDLAVVVPIAGVICFTLGAVGLAPALVAALGPLARRATGTTRLALRGLIRHRSQSSATVAAMAVALALPIGLLTAYPRTPAPANRYPDQFGTVRPGVDALVPHALSVAIGGLESADAVEPADAAQIREVHRRRQTEVRDALDSPATRISIHQLPLAPGPSAADVGQTLRMAVIADGEVARVLAPWAVAQVRAGRALVVAPALNAPLLVHRDGATTELPVATVPHRGAATMAAMEADIVVAASTFAHLRDARPLDAVAFVRPTPATPSERRRLEALTHPELRSAPTLAEVRAAMHPGATTHPGDAPESAVFVNVSEDGSRPPDRWAMTVLALAGAATVLALLVLTITLTLRSVDGIDDARAAVAAGAPPAAVRRLRAIEGVVLTTLGALLALPLGWLPAVAIHRGWFDSGGDVVQMRAPGWLALPVLVVPVVLAALLWTVVPAVRAAIAGRRPVDQVLPRW